MHRRAGYATNNNRNNRYYTVARAYADQTSVVTKIDRIYHFSKYQNRR